MKSCSEFFSLYSKNSMRRILCFKLCKQTFFSSNSESEIDSFEPDDYDLELVDDEEKDDDYIPEGYEEKEANRRHMDHVSSIFLEASKTFEKGEMITFCVLTNLF